VIVAFLVDYSTLAAIAVDASIPLPVQAKGSRHGVAARAGCVLCSDERTRCRRTCIASVSIADRTGRKLTTCERAGSGVGEVAAMPRGRAMPLLHNRPAISTQLICMDTGRVRAKTGLKLFIV
jgi:hypothetical protein